MAMVFPYVVTCSCGETITASLADGVNVQRSPAIRGEILAGRFHRVGCPSCRTSFTAEKSFFYTDSERGTFIQVKPRQDRHLWRDASAGLERAAGWLTDGKAARLRVVFGMAELREKLVAEDLELDDRAVELLKVYVLNDHPFLMQKPRLRLMLAGRTETELEFVASYDFEHENFRIGLPYDAARAIAGNRSALEAWTDAAGQRSPLFALESDHWVNLWRWSPQPSALDRLRAYGNELRAGRSINLESQEFRQMLGGLPRGAHLPGWAKQDVQLLFDEARRQRKEAVKDALFELRFAKTLADDWTSNASTTDIDTLWDLLRALPPADVEGNISIDEIRLAAGESGGWYEPDTADIYIGSRLLSDQETFEDVVRHEVGHGVHEANSAEVDAWLLETFGWRMFNADAAGLDAWAGLMGGWDAVTPAQRQQVLHYLRTALGTRSAWGPAATPNVPAGHVWWGQGFGPRLAYERTGANWYQNYSSWYRAGGRAFFINYWYKTFCVVDESTLTLIAGMPSSYAAMSTYEFFAELYALYYDLDDPKRGALAPEVLDWFEQQVGQPARRPAPPREREPFESITRPKG